MRSIVRIVLIATAISGASGVHAAPYKLMDLNAEALQAIDAGSITMTGNIANFWLFTQYWRPQTVDHKSMSVVKSRFEIDCSTNKMRAISINFFTDIKTPLSNNGDGGFAWTSIIPDSWFMKVRGAACDNKYGAMGKMDWQDFETMVNLNREIARTSYPSIP
ncbi:hypothetical protein HT136_18980 [Novosphingobium profundi]|uniref:surface-adhesin E family protein n=1 Tax=Novosphingobium profundi TaxID=1774954 RepID=UPI001BD9AE06|nr:surface-adhesin E family protein [Novosphingobium profundi]MBT0670456.1 hypothetical protein [Novosphingobium profundi]